ncbi:UDP-N-acetylmuramate dehydrogenase [Collinsella tanakaei]|uniref:UDP-N-acetylmuramate dehydrogenase n=1 Tax=Collinsella tanakaei TaxID=626935 RepID=UPI0019578107|nr:UDP-N-acetylmuramate dehydrogenase [Collinsella tanakaei]MBM6867209.1 UDP-N-acetylmuramate dehydrogenase [Collinsella tanakaei]
MHEYDGISDEVLCALGADAGEDNVALFEPMSAHTTFKIGGPADVVVTPTSTTDAAAVLDTCARAGVPVTVVGNGSDLLVGDRGIRGVVVLLRENLSAVGVEGTRVRAEAGALLRDVALAAADAELTGMEPLWGIPATVGGACHMNAGAYDAACADVLESVEAYVPGDLAPDGSRGRGFVRTFSVEDLHMGYRKSRVHDEGLIVLSATFALAPGNSRMIRAAMDDYRNRREEKQPLEMPSAGSTFKRPQGHFAGKLIMDAGLRGYRIGGAQVSEKHCGFVVNTGNATAADVNALIEHVQDEVKRQFGVELEPEVLRVGQF